MNTNTFKQFVIEVAKKHIFDDANGVDEGKKILKQPQQPKPPKMTKPSFTKSSNVNKLPKIPKTPNSPDPVTIAESLHPDTIKHLVEEMKKVNKKIDLRNPLFNPDVFDIISEEIEVCERDDNSSDRWKRLYEYKPFSEEPGDN